MDFPPLITTQPGLSNDSSIKLTEIENIQSREPPSRDSRQNSKRKPKPRPVLPQHSQSHIQASPPSPQNDKHIQHQLTQTNMTKQSKSKLKQVEQQKPIPSAEKQKEQKISSIGRGSIFIQADSYSRHSHSIHDENRYGRDHWILLKNNGGSGSAGGIFFRFEEIEYYESLFRILCHDATNDSYYNGDLHIPSWLSAYNMNQRNHQFPMLKLDRSQSSDSLGVYISNINVKRFLERSDLSSQIIDRIFQIANEIEDSDSEEKEEDNEDNEEKMKNQPKNDHEYNTHLYSQINVNVNNNNKNNINNNIQNNNKSNEIINSFEMGHMTRIGWFVVCKLVALCQHPPPTFIVSLSSYYKNEMKHNNKDDDDNDNQDAQYFEQIKSFITLEYLIQLSIREVKSIHQENHIMANHHQNNHDDNDNVNINIHDIHDKINLEIYEQMSNQNKRQYIKKEMKKWYSKLADFKTIFGTKIPPISPISTHLQSLIQSDSSTSSSHQSEIFRRKRSPSISSKINLKSSPNNEEGHNHNNNNNGTVHQSNQISSYYKSSHQINVSEDSDHNEGGGDLNGFGFGNYPNPNLSDSLLGLGHSFLYEGQSMQYPQPYQQSQQQPSSLEQESNDHLYQHQNENNVLYIRVHSPKLYENNEMKKTYDETTIHQHNGGGGITERMGDFYGKVVNTSNIMEKVTEVGKVVGSGLIDAAVIGVNTVVSNTVVGGGGGGSGALSANGGVTVSAFSKYYTAYSLYIRTSIPWYPKSEFSGVTRRFRDFEWLHKRLRLVNPSIILPPLPPKKYFDNNNENFVTERMEWLNLYCGHLSQNPTLWISFEVQSFLTSSPLGLQAAKVLMPAAHQGGFTPLQAPSSSSLSTVQVQVSTAKNTKAHENDNDDFSYHDSNNNDININNHTNSNNSNGGGGGVVSDEGIAHDQQCILPPAIPWTVVVHHLSNEQIRFLSPLSITSQDQDKQVDHNDSFTSRSNSSNGNGGGSGGLGNVAETLVSFGGTGLKSLMKGVKNKTANVLEAGLASLDATNLQNNDDSFDNLIERRKMRATRLATCLDKTQSLHHLKRACATESASCGAALRIAAESSHSHHHTSTTSPPTMKSTPSEHKNNDHEITPVHPTMHSPHHLQYPNSLMREVSSASSVASDQCNPPYDNHNSSSNNGGHGGTHGGGVESLECLGVGLEKFFEIRINALNAEFDSVVQLKFQQGVGESEKEVITSRLEAKKHVAESFKQLGKYQQATREARAAR
mmetsp:Transcript_30421/g.39208  ORF Transcript_30421/g.39208 Transcript_30421/m.39208 type:complete len:1245 (-) Transcript_30421:1213-4947(-)